MYIVMHKKLHPYWYSNCNIMAYYDDFWRIDAHENILSPACLIVFVKSKTEFRTYQICYCLLSSRQQSKMWNSCCNARPQTSSF